MSEFRPPLSAFYSYSHRYGRDRRHLDELVSALSRSRIDGIIDDWDDRKLRAGEQWEEAIVERARGSRVFLLILTNRFIQSDFCVCTELPIALALYREQVAAIAPILAEDADWEIPQLRDLQVIMPFGRPVSASTRAVGWTAVAKAVRRVADDLIADRYFPLVAPMTRPVPPLQPFTIGRIEATAEVDAALRAAPQHRPFVCVLTGERQGQSEFIESLLTDGGAIRNTLGLTTAHYRVTIDPSVWIRSRTRVQDLLNDDLAAQITLAPQSATGESPAAALSTHRGLSIVSCELSAAEWRECARRRFDQFLAYWSSWPDLVPDRRLIVFVAVRSDDAQPLVPGGVCVRLGGVTREAVHAWLDTPLTRNQFLVERIRAHLDEVFGPREPLAMDDFASRFLPVLKKFQIV